MRNLLMLLLVGCDVSGIGSQGNKCPGPPEANTWCIGDWDSTTCSCTPRKPEPSPAVPRCTDDPGPRDAACVVDVSNDGRGRCVLVADGGQRANRCEEDEDCRDDAGAFCWADACFGARPE